MDQSSLKVTSETGLSDLVEQIPNVPDWLQQSLSVPREEGWVNVDGCELHYFRWGDPSKPGLLLTHGFLAHVRCFAFIAPYLANDFHIVGFDMSGMGDSGQHEQYLEETRVKELLGVAEQTGLFDHEIKPTIIAHSFGGLIATSAAHQHADKFAGMIICDLMIIRPSILAANRERFGPPGSGRADKSNKVYPDYESAKKRFVLSPPQAVNEPVLFDYMAYHSLKQVDGGWTWKFDPRVFSRGEGVEKRWGKIGERLVVAPIRKAMIYGQESMLFTPDSYQYMQELFEQLGYPPFPIIGIPNARHHLMLDQPIAFASALKTVLAMWHS